MKKWPQEKEIAEINTYFEELQESYFLEGIQKTEKR